MWNAIRGDILEFVNTIQTDVASALVDHLKEISELPEGSAARTYAEELANSRATFEEEVHHHEYKAFRKGFRLNEYASDIARLLGASSQNSVDYSLGDGSVAASVGGGDADGDDSETETAQFFAELVPDKLTKEEFWARYYFRLCKLPRPASMGSKDDRGGKGGSASGSKAGQHHGHGHAQRQGRHGGGQAEDEGEEDDDEDEENIPWDDDDGDVGGEEVQVTSVAAAINAASSSHDDDAEGDEDVLAGARGPHSTKAAQSRGNSNTSSNSHDSNDSSSSRGHHNARMTMSGMQMIEVNAYDYNALTQANSEMKRTIRELKMRVAELEAQVVAQNAVSNITNAVSATATALSAAISTPVAPPEPPAAGDAADSTSGSPSSSAGSVAASLVASSGGRFDGQSGSASPTNSTHSSLVHVSSSEFNPTTAAAAVSLNVPGGSGRQVLQQKSHSSASKAPAAQVKALGDDSEDEEDEETWE